MRYRFWSTLPTRTIRRRWAGRASLRLGIVLGLGAALLMLALGAPLSPVRAASLLVNSLADTVADNGQCTLREAITAAETNSASGLRAEECTAGSSGSPDTIQFSVSGTIVLGSTLPVVSSGTGLTIDGSGQRVTISGNDAVQPLVVAAGAQLELREIGVAHGRGIQGGGIYNDGILTVTNSTISGNLSLDRGGGIFNGGTLTVRNSTFSNNIAGFGGTQGGGIVNFGIATVTNSTFTGNIAFENGGAMFNFSGTMSVSNSTISGNSDGIGGVGSELEERITLTNTIVANNGDRNCFGPITDGGGNLVWPASSGCPASFLAADPRLAPLALNAPGTTPTHALLPDSAAIDAGLGGAACLPTDQRGVPRPQGAGCDIGAFERESGTPSPLVAADTFSRTLSGSWGSADLGGPYSLFSTAADYSVSGGQGFIHLPAAVRTRRAILNGVAVRDLDLTFRVATDRRPEPGGAGQFAYFVARRHTSGPEYRGYLRFAPSGAVHLLATFSHNGEASGEIPLAGEVRVPGLTHAAGRFFWLRAQVVGASPTTVRLRAWQDGTLEPGGWQFTATNNSHPLVQRAGAVGLMAYVSLPAANAPVSFRFDDLQVTNLAP